MNNCSYIKAKMVIRSDACRDMVNMIITSQRLQSVDSLIGMSAVKLTSINREKCHNYLLEWTVW